MCVQWNYKYVESLLTKVALQVGSLRDPVDPDHGGVPDGVQHAGHDAHLLLLRHLHRVGSLGHRGKILDWTSLIISPRTTTCQVRSDKRLMAIRLCRRGTCPATSCLGPCQANWTYRWRECICRLNIRGHPCFGDIFSNWSHGKGRWVKLRRREALQG